MSENTDSPALNKNPIKKYCINGAAPNKQKNIPTYCMGWISFNSFVPGLLYFTIKKNRFFKTPTAH